MTTPPKRHASSNQTQTLLKALGLMSLTLLVAFTSFSPLSSPSRTSRATLLIQPIVVTFTPPRLHLPKAPPAPLAITLIKKDFPATQVPEAEKVAKCESHYNATDVGHDSNGTVDRGLFQFNSGGTEQELLTMTGHPTTDLNLAFNPSWNVRAAAILYHRDGWGPWSCA
jgi:hypothetical protein